MLVLFCRWMLPECQIIVRQYISTNTVPSTGHGTKVGNICIRMIGAGDDVVPVYTEKPEVVVPNVLASAPYHFSRSQFVSLCVPSLTSMQLGTTSSSSKVVIGIRLTPYLLL